MLFDLLVVWLFVLFGMLCIIVRDKLGFMVVVGIGVRELKMWLLNLEL